MRKNLQRIVICLLGFIFGLGSYDAKGQWVTIPDSNFVNWLNANGYASCMNGNLMDTTCSAVVSADTVNCGGASINNLDGIQYFDSLIILQCANTQSTPSSKWLLNIPAFPNSLREFACSYFGFTSLPSLPDSLRVLNCVYGALQSLPSLPNTLIELYCYSTNIDTLPTLPGSLEILYCYRDHLTFLPTLPTGLLTLNCAVNPLDSLPVLPDSLRNLDCSQIPNLAIPLLPDSLKYLDCRYNQWTTLPILPDSLKGLTCYNNQITTLPLLPPALTHLMISNNPLSSFPALPSTLLYLYCDSVNLSSLPSNLPPNLIELGCGHNPLTSLPEFPPTMTDLYCNYTSVTSIPDLNDVMYIVYIDNNPFVTCFPKYKTILYLSWANTNISCLPNAGYIGNANPSINNLPLCFSLSGCDFNWSMYGRIYNDTNVNCLIDTTEVFFKNLRVNLNSGGVNLQSFIFNTEGYYSFKTGYGNYEIEIDTTGLPFDVICPVTFKHTSSITSLDSTDENLDFGLVCKPGYFDLVAKSISPYFSFSPGLQRKVFLKAGDASLFYGVTCSAGINGTVRAILNGPITYVSPDIGAIIPTSVFSDTIIWNISDFSQVNPDKDFNIIVNVDSTASMYDTVCIQLDIFPVADSNPFNNSLSSCFQVGNSFDPNEKSVYPVGIIDTVQQWLTYTIYFQNTGNAPARYIYILDTLDSDLDLQTFQFLASSHDPIIQLLPNKILRFSFPDINLPDSTNNEPDSHGFVQYRVKTKSGLPGGTILTNRTYIFFDFNSPVQTNMVVDSIVDCNNLGSINFINQTPCEGDTLFLQANLAYQATNEWYVDSVFVTNNQYISIPNLSVGVHEIKLIAISSFCSQDIVSNVMINRLPTIDLGSDTTNCGSYLIDAGAGFSTYQWSSGETTQTIIANATANYSVVVTDSNGCSNADTIAITINALPIKPTIMQNVSLLTSSSAGGNQWLMNGSIIAGAINNTYNVTLTGWYSVMVTDSNGCSNLSDSIYMDLSGVSDVGGSKDGIRIVPNPATDEFRVLGLEFRVGDVVSVSDALGKVVNRVRIAQAGSNLKVETSGFNPGVYFVSVKTGEYSVVLKLVKN